MTRSTIQYLTPMHRTLPSLALCVLILLASAVSAEEQWKPLFNGKNLDGWKHVGPGSFAVDDGQLKTEGGMGLLYFEKQAFENVVLRIIYKNPGGKNGGVFIRIPEKPTEPWMPVNKGYEVQIDDRGDEYHRTGVLYSLTKARSKPSKPDEWNTMEITLTGDRTVIRINDQTVTDYTEGQPVPKKKIWYEPERGRRPTKGYIGLQNHGKDEIIYFKEVSVRPLTD